MTEKMEKKFATKFSEIKGELEAADYISFTTDGWKTKNGKKAFIRFKSKLKINLILAFDF